ncbi:hypothetical protein JCM3775_003899 [Rhodotorula graminis]|uniref:Nop52-domain-containing protein n=1 Tax=Rhodotorula graminis (strain WP1) TaxID=578459 RepID=A0A194S604_RHOGW|nr:uncharacterized protein RHOBADRAFT_52202 [Rhodotorula graminis WP1]KPV76158.1 hypothetical protein RHOBADRAFT_52202 [Rhodotorula graminis WP1]
MPADTAKRPLSATDAHPPAKKAKKQPRTSAAGGAPSSTTPPLGKFLASSEKHVRDKAVASLSRFLSAGRIQPRAVDGEQDGESKEDEELPVGELKWEDESAVDARLRPDEMDKLWKGIFYCFWMSDKPLVQQQLAQTLADLTLDVRPKSRSRNGRVERTRAALCYLRGFWHAIVTEWYGMDRHRLDKFLLLIRRFVHAGFRLLEREAWDEHAVAEYNEILTGPGGPLHVQDPKVLHTLAYHLADIYNDEIERTCSAHLASSSTSAFESDSDSPAPAPERVVPLVALLAPICHTLAICPTKVMFARFTDNVFSPLLEAFLPPKPDPRKNQKRKKNDPPPPARQEYPALLACAQVDGATSDAEAGPALARAVMKALFEAGGAEETDETNRRRIYEFVSRSGVDLE